MNFKSYSNLKGQHAFLSPSNYHWINYTDEKLMARYENMQAVKKGTELHDFAQAAIAHGIKLKGKQTLSLYVNDAIGYRMVPEQILYYSENCFGTADAIAFSEKNKFLRIHDLKTGEVPASMNQLKIYFALFCLDYNYKAVDIHGEMRIYQFNEFVAEEPDPDEIAHIMDKIIRSDEIIEKMKQEM